MNKSVIRKLKIWDFSSKLVIKKRIIETLYVNDKSRYSTEMQSFGSWTREYLVELGPTFIKLGQIASSRGDIFSKEFLEELVSLQDNVEPIPEDTLKQLVDTNLFEKFEKVPYKAASLGQVHRAVLTSGVNVAVKLQRPGIKSIILDDFDTIETIIDVLEGLGISTGAASKIVFREAKQNLVNELDYRLEAKNALKFRTFMEKYDPMVIVPRVFIEKSTETVLIMEWVRGIKVTDTISLKKAGIDLKQICKLLVESYIFQTMDFGFFHADPHPGNIAVSYDGRLIFYDFGLVIDLSPEIKNNAKQIILFILQKDSRALVDLFIEIGIIIPTTKNRTEISLFFDFILNYLEKITKNDSSIKETVLAKLAEEKPFVIPYSFVFLAKSFTLIDGICLTLDPDFKFIEYLQPYIEENVDVDFQQIAMSTFQIPSRINDILTSVNKFEEQRIEIKYNLENIKQDNSRLFIMFFIYQLINLIF